MAKQKQYDQVLSYLKTHSGIAISRKEIQQETGTVASALTVILKRIREAGYQIETPPRSGIVKLINEEHLVSENHTSLSLEKTTVLKGTINQKDLFFFGILLVLAKRRSPVSFDQLLEEVYTSYNGSNFYINLSNMEDWEKQEEVLEHSDYGKSIWQMRKAITALLKQEYIIKVNNPSLTGSRYLYKINELKTHIKFFDFESLDQFCSEYPLFYGIMGESFITKELYYHACNLLDREKPITPLRTGRLSQLPEEQLPILSRLYECDYKNYELMITYKTKEKHTNKYQIKAGLLYYSVETNCFYLLCKDRKESILQLRLDRVQSIDKTETKNLFYGNEMFSNIYDDIFLTGYEQKRHHVKVLFQDFGNIPERIQKLHQVRKNSSILEVSDYPELSDYTILYEDDIRGIDDFAHYIRSFGFSALVLEPEILQKRMIDSAQELICEYEKMWREQ